MTVDGPGSTWTNTVSVYVGTGRQRDAEHHRRRHGRRQTPSESLASTAGSSTINFDGGTLKPYYAGNTTWINKYGSAGTGNVYVKERRRHVRHQRLRHGHRHALAARRQRPPSTAA